MDTLLLGELEVLRLDGIWLAASDAALVLLLKSLLAIFNACSFQTRRPTDRYDSKATSGLVAVAYDFNTDISLKYIGKHNR